MRRLGNVTDFSVGVDNNSQIFIQVVYGDYNKNPMPLPWLHHGTAHGIFGALARQEASLTPLTFEQLVALGSLAVAVVTIALTIRRDGATDEERHAARVAEQQVMTDKLDSIADMSKETRDTVREMSKQLTEHSRELARIETRIEEHDRRLSAIEGRCDLHRTAGTE